MTLILLFLSAIQERGGQIEWTFDVERGLDASKRSGRPVMLYFTADW